MRVISLLSGGIDSAVATYLMLKKGFEVVSLHFDNRPFTDVREVNKAKRLARHLKKICNAKMRFFLVPHGKSTQVTIAKNCRRRYQCVLCRRMMHRIAEKLTHKKHAKAIITGESLGQVASQTLRNLRAVEQAITTPIIRPLIGLDKVEIIDIARKIGTYEISISPAMGCTIVPKKPATQARLKDILAEEKKILVEELMEEALEGGEVYEV